MHLALPVKRDDIDRDAETRPSEKEGSMKTEEENPVAQNRLKEWTHQQYLYYNFDPEYKGIDWRDRYDLENPEWRYDPIPEIMDGKNVLDFFTSDLEQKLEELEKEELALLRREALEAQNEDLPPELTPEQMEKVLRIREKRSLLLQNHRMRRGANDSRLPQKFAVDPDKTLTSFEKHLSDLGLDGKEVVDRIRDRSRSRSRAPSESREVSRSRSESRPGRKRTRADLEARGFSASRVSVQSRAYGDSQSRTRAERLAKKARRELSRDGRKGESDRHVFDLKPKHLYSGKRRKGKTDRR